MFRELMECQSRDEDISETFLRPVLVSLVSEGFDGGQAVEGFVELTETGRGTLASSSPAIEDSPIQSVYAAAHGAIDDLFREVQRLVEFEKQVWLLRGDANIVIDTSSPSLNVRVEPSNDALVGDPTITARKPLGTHRLPDNTRTHKHGRFDYRFEKRRVDVPVYAEFTGPRLSEIWNDIVQCTNYAITTAVITAVVTESPAAGYQIFYPTWRGCMLSKIGNRVNQIDVRLKTDPNQYGSWTNH